MGRSYRIQVGIAALACAFLNTVAADGRYRSKIGINPKRSKAILGSYDGDNKVLTIVQFTQPADVTDYVNSLWKLQDNPFGGDAANSYNDGRFPVR